MGNEGQTSALQHTLVVMSNKDTYYLSMVDRVDLVMKLKTGDKMFTFTDIRSGKRVTINLSQLSSIVEARG